ncbi:hypothetical protein ACM67B_10140 [Neisseria sp. CCUG17229]|uniref:hypothetical protein n=1 Tax=Neisseria sp. CCUG17229 TaxID=3392036 RepID=UPI003A0FEF82
MKIVVSTNNHILTSEIITEAIIKGEFLFAFYVYRNEQKIHVEWYQNNNIYSFDTEGIPGYYRIVGFAKNGDDIQTVKSHPIFANPLEISQNQVGDITEKHSAYNLKTDNWKFPCLYIPSKTHSNTLFVILSAATNRSKNSLPVFNRWTWAFKNLFPGNVMCVADPTLEINEDLNLGWFIGTAEKNASKELADFILDFVKFNKIPSRNVIFYGSSAGGFAALYLSKEVNESAAIAINPQTHALAYEAYHQVDLIRKYCFNDLDFREVHYRFTSRVDMSFHWRDVTQSRILLLQNILDAHHYEVHFKPFWHAVGGEHLKEKEGLFYAKQNIAWVYQQEGGHVPETEEMMLKAIELLQINDKAI